MISANQCNEWRIHVGAHKTATTHVQDTLESVRLELRARGVEYIPRQEIRDLGGFGKPLWWHRFVRRAPKQHWLYDYEQDRNALLFSEENIMGRISDLFRSPLYPDLEKKLGAIRVLSGDRSVTLFLTIRSFDEVLPSAYAQQMRMGKAGRIEMSAIIKNALDHPPRWSHVIERVLSQFDVNQLRIWKYEDYKEHQNIFLSHLCGGEVRSFPQILPPASTRSPSAETIRILEDECPKMPKEMRSSEAEKICSSAEGGSRFQPFSEEEVEMLKACYLDDVSLIEQKYPDLIIHPSA